MAKAMIFMVFAAFSSLWTLTKNEAELHKAAALGDTKKVEAILRKFQKKNDDVNATARENNKYTERGGWTALYLAAVQGHTETVKALIAAGGDPAMRIDDGFGETHCFLADVMDKAEIADLFLKAKAASACPELFLSTSDKAVAVRFLTGGLDANATVLDDPLLLKAVENDQADLVEVLITHKADINFRVPKDSIFEDKRGKSILDIANEKKNPKIIQLLKTAGAR